MREGPGQENLQLTMPELSSPCQFQFQFQHQLPPRARTTAPPAPPAAVSAAASPTPTPQLLLQQSIRMAQRRRLLTSPPFLLAASSAACLAGMALYFGYMHCAGSDQRAFSGVFVWPDDAEQSHYSWDAQTLQKGMVREGGTSKRLHASRGGDDDDDGSSTTSRGSASSYASSTSSNNNNNNNNGVASGGGGGGVTATTASSSGVDPMQLQNPSFYGWVPDWYPNPLVDPIRCSIAYLSTTGIAAALNNAPATTTSTSVAGQPNYPTSPSDDDSYDSADDTTDDDDGAVNEPVPQTPPLGNDSTNASRAGGASPPLPPAVLAAPTRGGPTPVRLCDPDWVLGTDYLEEIAMALSNFSRTFGRPDWAWRLQQQHSQSQSSSAVHYAHAPSRYRLHPPPDRSNTGERSLPTTVELGVATVRKINLAAVLREGSYFAYEDEDDMVNDAAQIFARTLHDAWWDNSNNNADPYAGPPSSSNNARRNGILVFLSIQDRVCFISTGSELASLLPWWRLDHIVASMKPDLQHREYGTAVLRAIDTVALLLQSGPPTWRDRLTDFVARFGVVLGFAAFTFCFGAWGEYRDRRKRWQYAEQRSQLSGMDRDKARQLQREYKTRSCPICLENLEYDGSNGDDNEDHEGEGVHTGGEYSDDDPGNDKTLRCTEADQLLRPSEGCSKLRLRRVDSYGIPLRGADHRPLKLLRCGHVFCERYDTHVFLGLCAFTLPGFTRKTKIAHVNCLFPDLQLLEELGALRLREPVQLSCLSAGCGPGPPQTWGDAVSEGWCRERSTASVVVIIVVDTALAPSPPPVLRGGRCRPRQHQRRHHLDGRFPFRQPRTQFFFVVVVVSRRSECRDPPHGADASVVRRRQSEPSELPTAKQHSDIDQSADESVPIQGIGGASLGAGRKLWWFIVLRVVAPSGSCESYSGRSSNCVTHHRQQQKKQ